MIKEERERKKERCKLPTTMIEGTSLQTPQLNKIKCKRL